jgi:hypothetical protein
MFYVDNHKASTLIPIIVENIPKNSTIISDKYSAYVNIKRDESKLEQYDFNHYWVNHSETFVDHYQDFIHTNGIERQWRCLRNSISTIKRTFAPDILQAYLDAFVMKSMMNEKQQYELILLILGNMRQNTNQSISKFEYLSSYA